MESTSVFPCEKRKSLEVRGFIAHSRFHKDERYLIVELTDAGAVLREKAKDIFPKMVGCVNLTPEEAAKFYCLLYKVLESAPN